MVFGIPEDKSYQGNAIIDKILENTNSDDVKTCISIIKGEIPLEYDEGIGWRSNIRYSLIPPPSHRTETSEGRMQPPSGAQNRFALRLAGHQSPSPYCAGWDRREIAVYS